jgi:hypothetical protein
VGRETVASTFMFASLYRLAEPVWLCLWEM